jgi:hypothetical protein
MRPIRKDYVSLPFVASVNGVVVPGRAHPGIRSLFETVKSSKRGDANFLMAALLYSDGLGTSCRHQHCQDSGTASHVSRYGYKSLGHGRMLLRQSFKPGADVVELIDLVQNRFQAMGTPLAGNLRCGKLQMD